MSESLPSKTFCILPWVHLFSDSVGDMHPCCLYRKQPSEKTYNLHNPEQISQYKNSNQIQEIKNQFLRGEEPRGCQACFEVERAGSLSYRNSQNDLFNDSIKDIKSNTSHFKSFDLRLGNVCNLKCSMCGPHSSILILNDLLKDNPQLKDDPEIKTYMNINWYEDEDIWENLFQDYTHVRRIHLTGGEPLLMPQTLTLMKKLVDLGVARDIELSFNSNITVIREKTLELFKRFKAIHLFASLDATGELNDYIRFPSAWEKVEQNLNHLLEKKDEYNIHTLQIHLTLQNQNIFNLPEFLEFIHTHPNLELRDFDFFPLEGPDWYNIRFLPHEVKSAIKTKFQQFDIGRAILESVLKILFDREPDMKIFENFKWQISHQDSLRKKEFLKIVPEYKEFF